MSDAPAESMRDHWIRTRMADLPAEGCKALAQSNDPAVLKESETAIRNAIAWKDRRSDSEHLRRMHEDQKYKRLAKLRRR